MSYRLSELGKQRVVTPACIFKKMTKHSLVPRVTCIDEAEVWLELQADEVLTFVCEQYNLSNARNPHRRQRLQVSLDSFKASPII